LRGGASSAVLATSATISGGARKSLEKPDQSVSFETLPDPSTGLAVSGLDDLVFATAREGTFYLADTGNDRILKIE
jgi:hypothetical protein